jgi:2-C-methyl-D-erythritol 4-phosphate cytidylyltransferase
MPSLAVIIPAAGSSTRYGGPRNKLLEPLRGTPVLARTVAAFLAHPDVGRIIVPTSLPGLRSILPDDPRLHLCPGGPSRAHSVRAGLAHIPETIDYVAVHDGARPLVSRELIDLTLGAAIEHGAAVPALPVALTIKSARGPLPAKVERTVPRQNLWAMQTPQIMRRRALAAAFETCPLPLDQVTDDVQLIELAGGDVYLIPGDERNLKITTPLDLHLATLLLC